MKKVAILLIVSLLFSTAPIFAMEYQEDAKILINGEELLCSNPLSIENGHTLAPLRELAEALCFTVSWEEPRITILSQEKEVQFTIGQTSVLVDGKEQICPRAPELVDGITYVPIRFLCEALGQTVEFKWADGYPAIYINGGTSSFAFSLLNQMPKDKNYMVSPLSIRLALAMAANGAGGETKEELLSGLLIENMEDYNEQALSLINRLNSCEDAQFKIANSIWLNTEYYSVPVTFQEEFQKTVSAFYQATADTVNQENAVPVINQWIEEQTNGRIKDVLQDPNFLAALVNTIYFKGAWLHPFSEALTSKKLFTGRDGSSLELDFLNDIDYYSYYEDDSLQMVSIPYAERNLSMCLVLPKKEITNFSIQYAMEHLKPTRVALSFPKFQTEYETELKNILQDMGIERPFSEVNAQFAETMFQGIPNGDTAFMSSVIHKTFIAVDEKGTEAAAATAISVGAGAPNMQADPVTFCADRPFSYFIRDAQSGEILFMGEYAYLQ